MHKAENSNDNELSSKLIPWWFWLFFFAMLVAWLFTPQLVALMGGKTKPTNSGEFGDQYGVLNALFSGLAFLGVLLGIFIQGKEFRNQLSEMAKTAKAMETHTIIYQQQLREAKDQTKILRRQLDDEALADYIPTLPFFQLKCSNIFVSDYPFELINLGQKVYSLTVKIEGGDGDDYECQKPFFEANETFRIEGAEVKPKIIVYDDNARKEDEKKVNQLLGSKIIVNYVLSGGVNCEEVLIFDLNGTYSCRRSQVRFLKAKTQSPLTFRIGSIMSMFE